MNEKIRQYFRDNYGHVNFQAMSDSYITDFMNQSYVKDLSFERQMDLMYDNILAQQLCEVVE